MRTAPLRGTPTRTIHKAVACVVRDGRELLVFDHPVQTAGTQLPRGTVEPDEDPAVAAIRELKEESGLAGAFEPVPVGSVARVVGAGPSESGPLEAHVWHLFRIDIDGLPDRWNHDVTGSPEEEGLVFSYRWIPLAAFAESELHASFRPVLRSLLRAT